MADILSIGKVIIKDKEGATVLEFSDPKYMRVVPDTVIVDKEKMTDYRKINIIATTDDITAGTTEVKKALGVDSETIVKEVPTEEIKEI